MRALCIVITLLAVTHANAYEQFVSPNRQFEAYTTAHWRDGSGMKLFLRRANAPRTGVLLRENNRWIDAKWSPDSRFLAVIDHFDGHIADVYVFGISAADAAPTLLYHTPELLTYDVQWDVIGWRVARREIVLDKRVKHESPASIRHEKIVAHIGTKPSKLKEAE
jgi:hypothetical protein